MTKLEFACVIIGFIYLFFILDGTKIEATKTKYIYFILFLDFVKILGCFCMIIFPLYFRYWK